MTKRLVLSRLGLCTGCWLSAARRPPRAINRRRSLETARCRHVQTVTPADQPPAQLATGTHRTRRAGRHHSKAITVIGSLSNAPARTLARTSFWRCPHEDQIRQQLPVTNANADDLSGVSRFCRYTVIRLRYHRHAIRVEGIHSASAISYDASSTLTSPATPRPARCAADLRAGTLVLAAHDGRPAHRTDSPSPEGAMTDGFSSRAPFGGDPGNW